MALSAISSTGIGLRATLSLHMLFNTVYLVGASGVTTTDPSTRQRLSRRRHHLHECV